jgi:serine/threonine protein kinase
MGESETTNSTYFFFSQNGSHSAQQLADLRPTLAFCGTPEYLACEILLGQPYSKQIDWFAARFLLQLA